MHIKNLETRKKTYAILYFQLVSDLVLQNKFNFLLSIPFSLLSITMGAGCASTIFILSEYDQSKFNYVLT